MFEGEPEDVKARMREEAETEHNQLAEMWQEAEEGLPSVDEEDQEEWVLSALGSANRTSLTEFI